MKRYIYVDHAATTPLSEAARQAMMPYLTEYYGNPSSLYTIGQEAKEALESARETAARCIGALPREITFIHSQRLLDEFPGMSPKEREDAACKRHGAVCLIGINAASTAKKCLTAW